MILLFSACAVKWEYIKEEEITYIAKKSLTDNCCTQIENYYPSEEENNEGVTTRYIRMNFHVIQSEDGTGNFSEKQANEYIKVLVHGANESLRKNEQMWLPVGNETPVLPPRFQYVITPSSDNPKDNGIYIHRDEELYYIIARGKKRNLANRDVIKKYALSPDSILNVFLLEHHKDSVAMPHFKAGNMGIAIGTSVKLLGLKSADDIGNGAWFNQQLLSHEVGHIFGLMHSWIPNDRCEDTPPHANCWNFGEEPCKNISNNVMDYNAHRTAWTPCQLGIIHKNMSMERGRQRKLLIKNWCELDESKNVIIQGEQEWRGARDIQGNIILEPNATLWIRCRTALPAGATITLGKGSTLKITGRGRIHNDCGQKWDGIIIPTSKKGVPLATVILSHDQALEDCKGRVTNSTNN